MGDSMNGGCDMGIDSSIYVGCEIDMGGSIKGGWGMGIGSSMNGGWNMDRGGSMTCGCDMGIPHSMNGCCGICIGIGWWCGWKLRWGGGSDDGSGSICAMTSDIMLAMGPKQTYILQIPAWKTANKIRCFADFRT